MASGQDSIKIRDLVLSTRIGVPDEERQTPQCVSVNAIIVSRISFSTLNDELDNTIDYFQVTQAMKKLASQGERKLIETLAEDLAALILDFRGVESVVLELEKYIIPNCGSVAVEIERSN